jgi:muconolactone delta-isomerase
MRLRRQLFRAEIAQRRRRQHSRLARYAVASVWLGLGARRMEEAAVEFLVDMVTTVPDGTSDGEVADMRKREAARSAELIAQRSLLRLWRPPLAPGEWRTWALFSADDADQLETILASMPLRAWRHDSVTPLSPHPSDPGQPTR